MVNKDEKRTSTALESIHAPQLWFSCVISLDRRGLNNL